MTSDLNVLFSSNGIRGISEQKCFCRLEMVFPFGADFIN